MPGREEVCGKYPPGGERRWYGKGWEKEGHGILNKGDLKIKRGALRRLVLEEEIGGGGKKEIAKGGRGWEAEIV